MCVLFFSLTAARTLTFCIINNRFQLYLPFSAVNFVNDYVCRWNLQYNEEYKNQEAININVFLKHR